MQDTLERGVRYIIEKVHHANMDSLLSTHVHKGDVIIDLACNIDCTDILTWCHDHEVLYINTSVELWDPAEPSIKSSPLASTLYDRHMKIRASVNRWTKDKSTTAIIDHGANPGLVSHFTKVALLDIAKKVITEKPYDKRIPQLTDYSQNQNFAKLASLLDVKVIHISERDTQITSQPKTVNEFVNTWSVEGFLEEGIAPSELGWGTHERRLPTGALFHSYGPGNQICIARPSIETWVRSWVPSGPINGMVIRHGEAFTISDHLTLWHEEKPLYRPTVHYAYCPSDVAIASLREMVMRNYTPQPQWRILQDDIISGSDEVGVLVMGHDFNAWWTGSILTIEEARRLAPHQNATTLQVACSLIAALIWMINNPYKGVKVPDDLPHEAILDFAKPYLGRFLSEPVDWTPLKNRTTLYHNYAPQEPSPDDLWQFTTFLL
jgi:homospermidine synthase